MDSGDWSDMLTSVLLIIARHMTYKSVCVASTVCKNWQQVFSQVDCDRQLNVVADSPNLQPLIAFLQSHKYHLHHVSLVYDTITIYVLSALFGASKLECLVLEPLHDQNLPHSSLEVFTSNNWPALKELALQRCNCNLEPLCQGMASDLQCLYIDNMDEATGHTWCVTSTWEQLEVLSFHRCWPSIVHSITRPDGFCSLYTLNLTSCRLNDSDFEYIVDWDIFPHLTTLNLSGNNITDLGIKYMCSALADSEAPKASDLADLDLSRNRLTGRSFKYMRTVTELHFIDLAQLNIKGIKMTKWAVDALCECTFVQQLGMLIIGESDISASMLERLETKLHDCDVWSM